MVEGGEDKKNRFELYLLKYTDIFLILSPKALVMHLWLSLSRL